MNIKIIKASEKKRILKKLEEQFGIKKLNFLLIQQGKDKIRGYTGTLSKDEILGLERQINIETIGTYLFKIQPDGLRLSLDACQIFSNQITKNIIKINDNQALEWLKGKDIDVHEPGKRFVVLENNNTLIGCGKLIENIVKNFVPKERRIKEKQ